MKWNWQFSVAAFFFVSIFGAILMLGRLSSPQNTYQDRELASFNQTQPSGLQNVRENRHQKQKSKPDDLEVRHKERNHTWFREYFEQSQLVQIGSRELQVALNLKAGYQETIDVPKSKILKSENGLIYFISEDPHAYQTDKFMPVVYDANRDALGVVTGKLMVKLVNDKDFDLLKNSYNLEHYYFAQQIRVHYFVVPRGSDPFEVYSEVRNLSFVEKAELEIIEETLHLR